MVMFVEAALNAVSVGQSTLKVRLPESEALEISIYGVPVFNVD